MNLTYIKLPIDAETKNIIMKGESVCCASGKKISPWIWMN